MANFNLALNMIMSINTQGITLNQFITPKLYNTFDLTISEIYGVTFCVTLISACSAVVVSLIERYAES